MRGSYLGSDAVFLFTRSSRMRLSKSVIIYSGGLRSPVSQFCTVRKGMLYLAANSLCVSPSRVLISRMSIKSPRSYNTPNECICQEPQYYLQIFCDEGFQGTGRHLSARRPFGSRREKYIFFPCLLRCATHPVRAITFVPAWRISRQWRSRKTVGFPDRECRLH